MTTPLTALTSLTALPADIVPALATGFLCVASMMGSAVRAAFAALLALRLLRMAALPALVIGVANAGSPSLPW